LDRRLAESERGIRLRESALCVLRRMGESPGSAWDRRLETAIAKRLLQLPDPPPDERSGVGRAGNIEGLAVASEPKDRVVCVRADVAEYPFHRYTP